MTNSTPNPNPLMTLPSPLIQSQISYTYRFNSLKGANGLGTLQFRGSIQCQNIQIPLDSGSIDNFFYLRLAHSLKLPVESANKF